MTINSNDAFGIEEFGIISTDFDGKTVLYITGGTGSPVGQAAPISTIYIDETGRVWRKFGTNVNDWRTSKSTRTITQTAHGFTLPTAGVHPLTYNPATSRYQLARANLLSTTASIMAIGYPDANTILVQSEGLVFKPGHGLLVGRWYVLSNTTSGALSLRENFIGSNIQYLVFVVDSETLALQMNPLFVGFIPQNIAIVNNWTQGANPALSTGTDRLLIAGVVWEEKTTPTAVSSIVVGGQTGTPLVSQTIISGQQVGITYYYFKESTISSMVGNTLTINWTSGAPDTFRTSTVLLQYVEQITPIIDINSDSGTGATDVLDADVNTLAGGYVFLVSGGGKNNMGFTNNGSSWTRKLDLTELSGADGVVDDKLITTPATPENVNMSISSSNRHVLVAASIRRREV